MSEAKAGISESGTQIPDFVGIAAKAESDLARLDPKLPAKFRFNWNGAAFAARVERQGDGVTLRLAGDFGVLPFTAEASDVRARLWNLVAWSLQDADFRFVVSRQRRVNLRGETPLAEPISGASIVAGAIRMLLLARPYIDIVREQRRVSRRREPFTHFHRVNS